MITTRRILKVNHAGEFGAIRIYGAQLAVARQFFPDIAQALQTMQADEIEHCRLFFQAMPDRGARPCRVMALWSLGGFVIGFLTAIAGRNAIWICTEAVEATVHRHLEDQLSFLETRDPNLFELIKSIQEEELSHLREAEDNQTGTGAARFVLMPVISFLTDAMIWLSTWGDSTWMRNELSRR